MQYSFFIAIAILISSSLLSCNAPSKEAIEVPAVDKATLEEEVWQMEELYWQYVEANDTVSYKKLWHDDFIGYPSFGSGVSKKSGIAIWIPELHQDTSLSFTYDLKRKAVNAIGDVVLVFYDCDEIWTDQQNNVVKKDPLKFTHTWKKYGDNWVILGGMAGSR